MKKLKFMAMAVLIICLAACSNSPIKPTSKKINGPLGQFFEVVERDYDMDGNNLTIEFKRIAEGGPSDASWTSEPTFTVELLGETGNIISSDNTDVVFDREALENVFSLGVGESTSIKFSFYNGKGASKFKVSSKWDANAKSESSSSSSSSDESSSEETEEKPSGLQPSDIILPSQLKGKVEVINGENGSIAVEYGSGDIPRLNITFKLLKKVSTTSFENPYGQVFIYGVPQDKSGRTVKEVMPNYGEWRPNDSDGQQFKDFLKGDVGETITLEFTGTSKKYDEKCDNEKGCPKIAKFKLAFSKL